MGWTAEKIYRSGNHLYAVCPHCKTMVRITGWFRGAHFCGGK